VDKASELTFGFNKGEGRQRSVQEMERAKKRQKNWYKYLPRLEEEARRRRISVSTPGQEKESDSGRQLLTQRGGQ